jgi:hypothetical protein
MLSAALLLACAGVSSPANADQAADIAVKASDIVKFAPFVDWPASVFRAPDSPFDLCVFGDDPFGPALDNAVANKSVDGHAIVIHRVALVDPSIGCEMAFIAGSAAQPETEGLEKLSGTPALTVTDGATAPGIIDFVTEGGRVRFRIDDQAAARNGLTISSKMLSLAVSVVPRPSESPRR